jgi:hypothetical protein
MFAVALFVLGVGGGWFVMRSTASAPVDACGFVANDIAKTWNPGRRVKLVAALAAGNAGNPDIATGVANKVDQWTADWTTARRELCEQSQTSKPDPWTAARVPAPASRSIISKRP